METFLSNKKVIIQIVLALIVFAFFFCFQPYSSEFVCNQNVCQVVNRNINGIVLSTQKISLSQIEKFEMFDYYNKFEGGKLKHIRYSINAVTKQGKSFRLLRVSSSSQDKVAEIVAKLNHCLETGKNININLK